MIMTMSGTSGIVVVNYDCIAQVSQALLMITLQAESVKNGAMDTRMLQHTCTIGKAMMQMMMLSVPQAPENSRLFQDTYQIRLIVRHSVAQIPRVHEQSRPLSSTKQPMHAVGKQETEDHEHHELCLPRRQVSRPSIPTAADKLAYLSKSMPPAT